MGTLFAVSAVDFGGEFRGNLLQMVVDAGPMVQFVLLMLLVFSIVSWAIILMKYRVISKTEKENNLFLDSYMNSSKLSDVLPESKTIPQLHDRGSLPDRLSRAGQDQPNLEGHAPGSPGHLGPRRRSR